VRDAAGRRRAPRGGGAHEEDDKPLLRVNDQNLLESNFFMGQKNDGSNYPHPSFYECESSWREPYDTLFSKSF
jgi:hypothetical protein